MKKKLTFGGLFARATLLTGILGAMGSSVFAQGETCATAITLNVGACGVRGTTEGANAIGDGSPACWASAASSSVWYVFTITAADAGWYTISTDNGINDLGEDMQLALYQMGASACSFDLTAFGGAGLLCNEDLPNPDNSNDLAAMITADLPAGTYYVQVDEFGAATGDFQISLTRNLAPGTSNAGDARNDSITQVLANGPYDLSAIISGTTSCFQSDCFMYNAPGDLPDSTDLPTLDVFSGASFGASGTNCNGSPAGENEFYGVWFRFDIPANTTLNNYLSFYPNNGGNFYVASLFEQTAASVGYSAGAITGLTWAGCSAGDNGLVNNGDYTDYNKAYGSMTDHPRLNLSTIPQNAAPRTFWVMLNQYARVLVPPPAMGSPVAAPTDGIYNVVIEAGPAALGIGSDGVSSDSCSQAKDLTECAGATANYDTLTTGLCNAGMSGNIWQLQGGDSATPWANEQNDFIYNGATGTYQVNCTGTNFVTTPSEVFNNNSAYYGFSVNGLTATSVALPANFAQLTLFQDEPGDVERSRLEVLGTELLVITTPALLPPGTPPPGLDTIRIPLLINNLTIAPCQARATVSFENISTAGFNGGLGEFYVYPADGACASSNATPIMGGQLTGSDDNCISLSTTSGSLPSGNYLAVVDGASGQLLKYDLRVHVEYYIPGTDIPCGSDCGLSTRPSIFQNSGFQVGIQPMPVQNDLNIFFNLDGGARTQIQVLDMSGRVVRNELLYGAQGANMYTTNVDALPAGIYLLNVTTGTQTVRTKFVKE